MLFFINPAPRAKQLAAAKKRLVDKRKKRSHSSRSTSLPSASVPARSHKTTRHIVAKKRVRRRRKATTSLLSNGRRRKRRAAVTHRNPPKRRRRRTGVALFRANPGVVVHRNPRKRRRHHFRRNPGLLPGGARGIANTVMQGLKDGASVVGGQIAARKIRGAVTGMLPAETQASLKTGVGYVALSIASAIGVAIGARKLLPAQARFLAAGAFSEAINAGLAQTPVAPYLGAFAPPRRVLPTRTAGSRGVSAWPMAGAPAGLGAWPMPGMRAVGGAAMS